MADAIVINKADGDAIKNATLAKNESSRALNLYGWTPKVTTCSTLHNTGIVEIHNIIENYILLTKKNGYFRSKRNQQNKGWLFEIINNELKHQFYNNLDVQNTLNKYITKIENNEINPFKAAKEVLKIKK